MDYHWFKHGMMGGGQCVGVIDSSSAVDVRVGKDNNVLVGDTRQSVMDRLYSAGSQIAV